jgi:glycosyltransferase involved in cell wall biosynthesis
MRKRGHEVILAVSSGGGLVEAGRKAGFTVYELNFKKQNALWTLPKLLHILNKHQIDLVNTHSSLDAWIGGIAARIAGKKIVRTRHLSTPIRKGLNSFLLYKKLTDFVVTTSSAVIPVICEQSGLAPTLCRCIPTGVDPSKLSFEEDKRRTFRKEIGVLDTDILIGTACFVRSWKGILDLMQAAKTLKHHTHLKWVIVGGGHVKDYVGYAKEMEIEDILTFTGHLESPYAAIGAMDIFTLLSTAHEGVSQASLQAAFLKRPLITTSIGGLPEVCIHEETGLVVPPFAPDKVADAVLALAKDPALRQLMGENAHKLVENKFTLQHTLDHMEEVYKELSVDV